MASGKIMIRRFEEMLSDRQSWEPAYKDRVDFIRIGKHSIDSFTHRGQDMGKDHFDSTAPIASANAAKAFATALTPKAVPWSAWKIPERSKFNQFKDEDFTQQYLNEINTTQFFIDAASNFHNVINEIYWDYWTFHTAALFSDEKRGKGLGFQGMTYRALPISSYVFAENVDGLVDTLGREFELTARQAAQQYPKDKLPSKIIKALSANKLDDKFTFIRMVGPREDFDQGKVDRLNMPFAVFDILKESGEIVDEGGYHEFPFHVGRFDKASGECRGRGPTDLIMGDVKSLNKLRELEETGLGKAINPIILAQNNSFVGTVRMKQNAINYARDIAQVRTLPVEFRMDLSSLKAEQLKQDIRDAYLADQLALPRTKQMTAEEVATLRSQVDALLGPTVERITTEVLQPKQERQMRLLFRRGVMPAPPEELEGLDELDIEFLGPLSQGQKQNEIRSATSWITTALELSSADPSIMDNVDLDEFIRWSGPAQGVPKNLQKDLDEVQRIRDARREEQETQEAIDQAGQLAETASKAAPLFSEGESATVPT